MLQRTYWPTATKIVVGSMLGLLALWLLVVFRAMIGPTAVAGLVVFILNIPVKRLQNRDLPRGLAVVIVYALLVGFLALLWLSLGPWLQTFLGDIQQDLDQLLRSLNQSTQPFLQDVNLPFLGPLDLGATDLFAQFNQQIRTTVFNGLGSLTSYLGGLTSGLLSVIYVFVLSFWMLKDWNRLKAVLANAIPEPYLTEAQELVKELNRIWSAFLRGQVLLGLVVGGTVFLIMAIVGLPNARALAIIAGVMEFLPIVGPIISGVIGVSVALLSGSHWLPIANWWFAGLVALLYIVIGQVESVYFIPRFIGRRVHLHPAVTFAVIILGALEFGVIGVLLAAPTFASSVVLVRYIWYKLWDRPGVPRITEEAETPRLDWSPLKGDQIGAIVFTLDGTLTCINERLTRRVNRVLGWFFRGQLWPTARRRQALLHWQGDLEGLCARLYNLLLRLKVDDARLQRHLHPWMGLAAPVDLQLRDEVLGVLNWLRQRRYQLGLITIRSRNVLDTHLRAAGLPLELFDIIVTREDVPRLPPQRDTVRQALRKADCPAQQLLLVGSSDVNLRPGRTEEMHTVAVQREMSSPRSLQEQHLTVASLAELQERLR